MSGLSSVAKQDSQGYQLGVVQEVFLALLADAPAHGFQLRARLELALGQLAHGLNAGQVYVTLRRLEKAGLVEPEGADHKVFGLTAAGRERLDSWLRDTSWPKPAPAGFHLKLVAAAAAGLADPVRLIDTQRHALIAELAAVQRAALAEPSNAIARLPLEGVILRLQADLRWLELCVRHWTGVTA